MVDGHLGSFGYSIGSVPFAFLLARRAGIDVRVAGSGNVGAANVLRTTGAALGVTVMALDISKGAAAVFVDSGDERTVAAMAAAGAAAVVGHIYPSGCGSTAAKALRSRPACSACWRRSRRCVARRCSSSRSG